MTYVGIVTFVGYREWTESLGSDREWYIQALQAKLHQLIQLYVKDFEGIALPMRFDIQLILLPADIDPLKFTSGLRGYLKPYTPTPVRITLCCGDIPDVLKKCACLEGLGDYIEECGMKEIAVAHADLNYFTSRTSVIGPYLSYAEVTDLVANITRELKDKAIVQYLGGDNLAVVTNKDHLKEVVDVITSKDNIKVGVGISKYPRKAFELAAQALKVLRDEGRTRSYHILLDK